MADMSEMEKFFGLTPSSTDKQIVKAVKKKEPELEELAKKPDKTPEQDSMIKAFERIGLLTGISQQPGWNDKSKKEAEGSILETYKKLMGIKAPEPEEKKE